MTLGIIMALILLQFVAQIYWLEDFYLRDRQSVTVEAIDEITYLIEHDEHIVMDSLIDYGRNQGIHIGIFNEDGQLLYRNLDESPSILGIVYEQVLLEGLLINPIEDAITIEFMDEFNSLDYLVIAKGMNYNDDYYYVIGMVSLQSIRDIMTIVQKIFFIILIVVILVAIVVTFVISKTITNPLIHLKDITSKLAKQDFSSRCEVASRDEIYELSNNINIMSDRLEASLNELEQDIMNKDRLEKFRKQFIADISHELKTPITIAKGISEGLIDGVYEEKEAHYKTVLEELDRMDRLVYDLLEVSKLDVGEETLDVGAFQLSDVVLKVHNQLKALANEKDMLVTFNLDEAFCSADEKKVEKVIRNLYTNAVNYSKKSGFIDIHIKNKMSKLLLSIENGPAHIPNEELDYITSPFYRIEKSRSKSHGGTGLGLYIVKSIVEKHDSRLNIVNTDKGVSISFELDTISKGDF